MGSVKLWHGILLIVGVLMLIGGVLAVTLPEYVSDTSQDHYLEWADYYDALATQNQDLADQYWEWYLYLIKPKPQTYPTDEELLAAFDEGLKGLAGGGESSIAISPEEYKYKSEYYAQLAIEYRAEAYRYRALAQQ